MQVESDEQTGASSPSGRRDNEESPSAELQLSFHLLAPLWCVRRSVNRPADALIGAAAAEIAGERGVYLSIGGLWSRRQQCCGSHELARLAVAALWHVLSDPGMLQRVISVGGEAFDRGYRLAHHCGDRCEAGASGDAIEMHRSGAAEASAAAKLGARQTKHIAQHPEQGRLRLHRDVARLPINSESKHGQLSSSCARCGAACRASPSSAVPEGGSLTCR